MTDPKHSHILVTLYDSHALFMYIVLKIDLLLSLSCWSFSTHIVLYLCSVWLIGCCYLLCCVGTIGLRSTRWWSRGVWPTGACPCPAQSCRSQLSTVLRSTSLASRSKIIIRKQMREIKKEGRQNAGRQTDIFRSRRMQADRSRNSLVIIYFAGMLAN